MAKGYLPEAIVNYIALLGWSTGSNREFFSLEDLINEFDIQRINKSKAAFSIDKLDWLNGEHIRALSEEAFHQAAERFYPEPVKAHCDTRLISKVFRVRVTHLTDIPQMTRFLQELPDYSVDLFEHSKSKSTVQSSLHVLQAALEIFPGIETWNEEALRLALMEYAAQTNLKTGTLMWPIRVAVSGQALTPGGATEIAAILGKEETLARVRSAVDRLEKRMNHAV